MKIDTETNLITDNNKIIDLYSKEGFKLLSDLWLKVGWDQKYMYSFTWLGRPIIQIPEDIIRNIPNALKKLKNKKLSSF